MDPAQTRARSQPATTFEDGFGRRQHVVSATKDPVEVLVLKRELIAAPSFEAAVRERIEQVGRFHHDSFVRVRGLARLAKTESGVAVVFDRIEGTRLSTLLDPSQQRSLGAGGALMLVSQLLDALVAFHGAVSGGHGAIGPERLVLTPNGRLMVTDHVFGAALPKLPLRATELWEQLRVTVPPAATPVFDQQTDIVQAGSVALALMLGRPLGDSYPNRVGSGTAAMPMSAALKQLPDDVAGWISRAIQRRGYEPFVSSAAARDALAPAMAKLDRVRARTAVLAFYSGEAVESTPAPVTPIAVVQAPAPIAVAPARVAPAAVTEATAPVPAPVIAAARDAHPLAHAAEANDAEEEGPGLAFAASSVPVSSIRRFFVPMTRRTIGVAAGILMLLTTGGAFAAKSYFAPAKPAVVGRGTLAVTTTPAGASVVIDGQQRGRAPLTIELVEGEHVLQVGADGTSKTIAFTIAPGAQVSQVIDLPKAVAATGQLQIRTEPSGAKVQVDGQRRGVSPLTVEGLLPGSHTVTVEGQFGPVNQEVTIESGVTAALVVPLGAPNNAPVSGWMSIASPVDVQIFEKGQLLGSSRSERIMASVGRHDLDIANDALGFRVTRSITVVPGEVSSMRVDPPKGTLSLNAVPWAEVWIDGQRAGETPIGNIQVSIGQHEVVFRHPELGEQRYTPTVTLNGPARLSADLRRKP